MRVISLNIWGGRRYRSLIEFISKYSKNTDVFCFQEVFSTGTKRRLIDKFYRANIFKEIQKTLPEHKGYFAPIQKNFGFKSHTDFDITWGIALFIRKIINVKEIKDFFIFGKRDGVKNDPATLPRNLQYARISHHGKKYLIAHFHGLFNGKDKLDSPDRIRQSMKVKNFLDKEKGKKILMGDLNLHPETDSLHILEKGMINLIKEKRVKTTRSGLYPYSKQDKFADYTLVSKDILARHFSVPKVRVSDHLPMILECE
jgi:exonuclease III